MIGLKVSEAKKLFFDRAKVLRSVDRATRRVLSKFGAFVRMRARTSMKRRRKVSKPGQPPSAHVGLVKELLFFVYEPENRSVLIGPAKINKPANALEALEYGGASKNEKGETVHIRPRPFMRPAFEAEKAKLPDLWANSVK